MTQINPKDLTLRDKIARTIKDEIGADIGAEVYGFEDAADAIIAALPDMVARLVWHKSNMPSWDGDYHSFPTGYTIRCADENGYKWTALGVGSHGYCRTPTSAMLYAQAHHAAAVVAAFAGSK